MARAPRSLGLIVLALLSATGCSGGEPAAGGPIEAAAPTTPTAATPEPSPGALTPGPTGVPDFHDEHSTVAPPAPQPTWDDASRTGATQAAAAIMTAFARPELPSEQWWSELAPLLSPGAQEDYYYVDPINVPARAVTGAARVVDETSAFVAHVEVPTDYGTYLIILSREDADAPWLGERITPPTEPAGQ